MNILVINGSPQKEKSVTLHYVLFIKKFLNQHDFTFLHISDFDKPNFECIKDKIIKADAIIWSFPVYFFSIPAQLKFIIEQIFDNGLDTYFKGKYASAVSTSIKLYDSMAHKYIHAISEQMGLLFFDGFSAEINDIFNKKERERLKQYALTFTDFALSKKQIHPSFSYVQKAMPPLYDAPKKASENLFQGLNNALVLYTNDFYNSETHESLYLLKQHSVKGHYINFSEEKFGFCTGCLQCGYDNKCSRNDGFDIFFKTYTTHADPLIFIIEARDLIISHKWKIFIDRIFFNGHIPMFQNKRAGIIITGTMPDYSIVVPYLELWCKAHGATLCGTVIKELSKNHFESDLSSLLSKIDTHIKNNYISPPSSESITVKHIVSSYVNLDLKPIFYADKTYYKKPFDLKSFGKSFTIHIRNFFLLLLLRIPSIRKAFYKKMVYFRTKKFSTLIDKEGN
ncbi:MAG: NAD(P)H-dependent oxidoreductase [Bacteroidales bacterium]|nr:NAD(P)H-dependent oxidoreductase [Bacteroidales bacterium]